MNVLDIDSYPAIISEFFNSVLVLRNVVGKEYKYHLNTEVSIAGLARQYQRTWATISSIDMCILELAVSALTATPDESVR